MSVVLLLYISLIIFSIIAIEYFFRWKFLNSYDNSWLIITFLSFLISLIHPTSFKMVDRVIHSSFYNTADWKSPIILLYRGDFSVLPQLIVVTLINCLFYFSVIKKYKSYYKNNIIELFFLLLCSLFSLFFIRTMWMAIFNLCSSFISNISSNFEERSFCINEKFLLLSYIVLITFKGFILPSNQPENIVNYMLAKNIKGNVFSDWKLSGYISWTSKDKIKIFVDTRIEPYSHDLITLSRNITENPLKYLKNLVEYNTNYIILSKKTQISSIRSIVTNNFGFILHEDENFVLIMLDCGNIRDVY